MDGFIKDSAAEAEIYPVFALSSVAQISTIKTVAKNEKHKDYLLGDIIKIANTSPTARMLVKFCGRNGLKIQFDPALDVGQSCFYARQNKLSIGFHTADFLKTYKGAGQSLLSLVSGLRRAWHEYQNHKLDISLKPQDFLKLYRSMEADVNAITAHICWEIRSEGSAHAWRQMISNEDGDIALVYARIVETEPRAQYNGDALKAAYDQWFGNRSRGNLCDHHALEYLDELIGLEKDKTRLFEKTITAQDLENTGALPGGTNYLKRHSLDGMWYKGLQDPVNRTHLNMIIGDLNMPE